MFLISSLQRDSYNDACNSASQVPSKKKKITSNRKNIRTDYNKFTSINSATLCEITNLMEEKENVSNISFTFFRSCIIMICKFLYYVCRL